MGLKIVTAPSAEPVTTSEAKSYLRITDSAEDTLIGDLVTAAREWAEGVTRRAFVTQTWDYVAESFPAGDLIELPLGRCQQVVSVTYRDTAGVLQSLSGSSSSPQGTAYREDLSSDEAGRVYPPYGETWPATRDGFADLTVRFVAGYGAAAAVPKAIKAAVLFRIADLYEHRGSQDGELTRIAEGQLMPYAVRVQPCI